MRKIKCFLLCFFLLNTVFSSYSYANENGVIVDVNFSQSNVHNGVSNSNSKISKVATERIGEFTDEVYTVQRLAKKGTVSFNLSVDPDMPITLEFEEIHNKSFQNYGYYVNVEGTDVFLRTGRETSAGPTHFFVKVPEELTKNKTKISVTLRNVGDFSVDISRIWAHSNIESLLEKEGIDSKLTVYLITKL